MIVVVYNQSRKRKLKQTKRILSSVLLSINDRIHIGNIPSRNIIDLIKYLRKKSGAGVKIKFMIESKEGYHGFKLIFIGKKEEKFDYLEEVKSSIDDKLIKEKIIPNFFDVNKKTEK